MNVHHFITPHFDPMKGWLVIRTYPDTDVADTIALVPTRSRAIRVCDALNDQARKEA